ncbi:complement decay-accelerating factor [Sorex fumeus]|uniref:complement decay-accelerating factor n=1 Tax=Sorex fumeus TaxID=62283 RepID=UPI0024AE6E5D|nr:complement decay-accelerating factor [Sorex fumeus]
MRPAALVLLLPLLLGPPAARGDCGLPPEVPNALPDLQGLSSFPERAEMVYRCNPGFVKVPGRPDSALCDQGQWSELDAFCNRSCDVPTRLLFASLQRPYSEQNYFPVGSSVEYKCRAGFQRVESLSRKITCLPDLRWSKADEFCKKKSCPNPGEIRNGHVMVTTDILYGSSITFSCNPGYELVGADSSYCSLMGDTVGWSDPLPECKEIVCPEPPEIDHAVIQEPQDTYVYGQSVSYKCKPGFTLVGENVIHCTAEAGHGAWSSPYPVCKEHSKNFKVIPAIQKSISGNGPGTETQLPPLSPTSSPTNFSETHCSGLFCSKGPTNFSETHCSGLFCSKGPTNFSETHFSRLFCSKDSINFSETHCSGLFCSKGPTNFSETHFSRLFCSKDSINFSETHFSRLFCSKDSINFSETHFSRLFCSKDSTNFSETHCSGLFCSKGPTNFFKTHFNRLFCSKGPTNFSETHCSGLFCSKGPTNFSKTHFNRLFCSKGPTNFSETHCSGLFCSKGPTNFFKTHFNRLFCSKDSTNFPETHCSK